MPARALEVLSHTLAFLALPTVAEASPGGDAASEADVSDEAIRRLNQWVPARDELDAYLPLVRDLLQAIARDRAHADGLDPRLANLFRSLVPATAWQESCWRQFVRQGGKRVPLRSPVGAVGIMQVNQSVWRGFYDADGLQRDMRYNARAGTEILSQYLRRHVAPSKHGASHDDDLARALYAVYNGGPGQLRRLDRGSAGKRERAVHAAFRAKVAKIRAGDALAVRECFGP